MRRLRTDDGASAVFVMIVIAVLVGFGAWSIDVGAIYQERRELQNGADAAALAAAQDCAERLGSAACASHTDASLVSFATSYADANANDAAHDARILPQGDILPAGSAGSLATDWSQNRLRVETSTRADGNPFLTHVLAPVFGNDTHTVHAYATAIWGRPGSIVPTLPIIISICEWDAATAVGTVFPSAETKLEFHKPQSKIDSACPVGTSGMDSDGDGKTPGGFGWLETDKGGCDAVISENDTVEREPGNSLPNGGCDITTRLKVGETLLIPIFDDTLCSKGGSIDPCADTNKLGHIDTYHVYGFAAIKVTGFRFPSYSDFSGTSMSCPPSTSCLTGTFEKFVSLDEYAAPGGTVDLGVSFVDLVG